MTARERPHQVTVDEWLTREFESEATGLERLAGDAELLLSLQQVGFSGPEWDYFANELARYGLAVIKGWMKRGLIESRCAEKRIPVRRLTWDVLHDESAITAIADETVAEAIDRFRHEALMGGIWDPGKGASLRTFFIGQCLLRYGNVLSRWYRHELPTANAAAPDELFAVAEALGGLTPVEDDVIRSQTAEIVLRGASSERAARALALNAYGYTNAEIAAIIGATESAVANLLKRERARLRPAVRRPQRRGTA